MVSGSIKNHKIETAYELKYWTAHRKEPYNRAQIICDLFPLPQNLNVVADIGCGPRTGIFHTYHANKMFAVDPLWKQYIKNKLHKIPPGVTTINAEAEQFKLPKQADLIVSANALDHSGSLLKSINNIMKNLKSNGLFCFHMHMRTTKQLNKGHNMVVTEKEIDKILAPYEITCKIIYKNCPIEQKPYKSYVATIQKP